MSRTNQWASTATRILTHPATARAAMKAVESFAHRVANPPTNDWIDAGLGGLGLRREPTPMELVGQAIQWMAAGAALGAGATMATPAMRPVVNDALHAAEEMADAATSQSRAAVRQLRSMAMDRGDDALSLVGLQRIPSSGRRLATTAAWIGMGVATGIAVGMAISDRSRAAAPDVPERANADSGESASAADHADGFDAEAVPVH